MFNNIGSKIKSIAFYACMAGIVISVGIGLLYMAADDDLVMIGLLIAVAGSLVSWVTALFLYGFGKLVENSDIIAKHVNPEEYSKINSGLAEPEESKTEFDNAE